MMQLWTKKSTKCKGYLYEIACLLKIWPWLDTPHMWWTCRMHIVLTCSQFYSLLKEFYFCWYWSQAAATCKLYIICCTYQFCFWIRDFGSRSQLDNLDSEMCPQFFTFWSLVSFKWAGLNEIWFEFCEYFLVFFKRYLS